MFQAVRRPDPADLVRGQFRGYRDETGVKADSQVETFAAVRLFVDSWRWKVPFLIRAGKRLALTATEAVVKFRRPPIFRTPHADRNYLRFRLGPDLSIALGARVKSPGKGQTSQWNRLSANRLATKCPLTSA